MQFFQVVFGFGSLGEILPDFSILQSLEGKMVSGKFLSGVVDRRKFFQKKFRIFSRIFFRFFFCFCGLN